MHGSKLEWLAELPETMRGVVVGNEVLDAMPVELIHFDGVAWRERGVVRGEGGATFAWGDRESDKRPPVATPSPAGVRR
jgi:SAM-dependent MidA family methyltransferase